MCLALLDGYFLATQVTERIKVANTVKFSVTSATPTSTPVWAPQKKIYKQFAAIAEMAMTI